MNNIEATVSDFISRAYDNCLKSAAKLKTEKGRDNRISRFAEEMKSAFEKADSFWSGDTMRPHYNGILFTENNMNEVLQLESKSVDWSKITEDNCIMQQKQV